MSLVAQMVKQISQRSTGAAKLKDLEFIAPHRVTECARHVEREQDQEQRMACEVRHRRETVRSGVCARPAIRRNNLSQHPGIRQVGEYRR